MKSIKHGWRLGATGMLATLAIALIGAPALAAGPTWRVSVGTPDYANAGGPALIDVWVENTGDVPLTGELTVADTFPSGITPVDPQISGTFFSQSCVDDTQMSTCTVGVEGMVPGAQVRFRYRAVLDPSAAGTLVNSISVSGGGMPGTAQMQQQMTVGPAGPFDIKSFGMNVLDANGDLAVQAGSAPREIDQTLRFRTVASPVFLQGETSPVERLKDTVVHVPPGLIGNPTATPVRCTASELTSASPDSPSERIPDCPQDSQIGIAHVVTEAPGLGPDIVPVYNMVPRRGAPAEFGFAYDAITVALVARLRPSDDGIDIMALKTPASIGISEVDVTLWGVPADSSHDYQRHLCLDGYMGNSTGQPCRTSARPVPFLRTPTSCGDQLPWSVDVTTYTHPDPPGVHADTTTPAMTGCELLPFGPSFSLSPSEQTPHTPTGLEATVSLPQDTSATGLAEADLRTSAVTLPEGMTINASSANGLQACTDGQLNLGKEGTATCPDASKIGTVALNTPLLDHPVGGSIFLRTQNSDDPASGELFRIAVEIRSDDDGVDIKLPASIRADPATGRLTTTFDDLPQLPFSTLQLHFKTGQRAPLVTPSTCGDKTTDAELTPWSGTATVSISSPFSISGDAASCAGTAFSPAFRAGTENPVAGASTPFHMTLTRGDDDQQFKSLTVYTPTGLLGRIKSAQQCSSAAAVTGACPSGSQIGSATVGAGAGSNPFYITNGKVFLTGPYKGAPYGLAIVVHALAGPFDLGTVVVRAAIDVDSRTAALKVVSDAFPTILKGVPLNLRDVRISIDKPKFMVNPTSCATKHVAATVTSLNGANHGASSRFQVGDCRELSFAPHISMSVGSRGHTGVRHSTPLTTTITQSAGQSNLRKVDVTLPTTLDALLPVVNRACTLAQYDAGRCGRARAGSAVAVTPLLNRPLRGGAYFVRHPGRPLPDLMIALRGEVSLDLVGRVTIPGGTRLRTNFDTIPDAPITRFQLKIVAGGNGPIGVVTNLCSKKARNATVAISMRGQNGAAIDKRQRLHVGGCGSTARRHR